MTFRDANGRETAWQRGLAWFSTCGHEPCACDRIAADGVAARLPAGLTSTIPPIDRDEARFAQATKQMVETGDYIDIRFQDDVRYNKPVGIYWMQAAVVKGGRISARGGP